MWICKPKTAEEECSLKTGLAMDICVIFERMGMIVAHKELLPRLPACSVSDCLVQPVLLRCNTHLKPLRFTVPIPFGARPLSAQG